jgi:hypothetical protein
MARLVTWAKATGGAALATLGHGLPMLILVTAGVVLAGLAVLVWILSDDRRTERLNLLLRGDRPAGVPAAADPESVSGTLPPSNSQTTYYVAFLRRAGRPDLAELLEQAPRERSTSEPGLSPAIRPQRT